MHKIRKCGWLFFVVISLIPYQVLPQVWPKYYGQTGRKDYVNEVLQTYDGGYLIMGVFYSDPEQKKTWLIKTDVNGNILWEKIITGK